MIFLFDMCTVANAILQRTLNEDCYYKTNNIKLK